MATENKQADGGSCNQFPPLTEGVAMDTNNNNKKKKNLPSLRNIMPLAVPRVFAFFATASATIVMALDKQTKSFVVATIGTTPVKATLTAKFHHNPAFVFFVIANGIASLHSLLMLVFEFSGQKFDLKGLRHVMIPILDMMTVAVVSAGAGGAFFMGELGRNGNSHARWNKTCDKFDTFCNHALWAFVASFIGLVLLMTINTITILKLRNQNAIVGCSTQP